jgi:hypothetical protein
MPASTPATSPPRRGAALPAAICFPGLIPSVRFRSNGSDRGYRFAHVHLTPWPAYQRCPQPPILLGLIFPHPILIERLGTPRTPLDTFGPPRTPLDPFRPPSDPSPSDLDRMVRTPSDPCSRPFSPLELGPLGQRALPLSLTLPVPPVSARSHARALDRKSNLGCRFLIQRLDSLDTPSRGCFA